MSRPPVSFIAWSPVGGRSEEIAEALGGEARCFYRRGRLGPLSVIAHYGRSAVASADRARSSPRTPRSSRA